MQKIENLKILMDKVFEPDGSIRPCGRQVCRELITAASNYDQDTNFGDLESGRMNVEAMLELRSNIT